MPHNHPRSKQPSPLLPSPVIKVADFMHEQVTYLYYLLVADATEEMALAHSISRLGPQISLLKSITNEMQTNGAVLALMQSERLASYLYKLHQCMSMAEISMNHLLKAAESGMDECMDPSVLSSVLDATTVIQTMAQDVLALPTLHGKHRKRLDDFHCSLHPDIATPTLLAACFHLCQAACTVLCSNVGLLGKPGDILATLDEILMGLRVVVAGAGTLGDNSTELPFDQVPPDVFDAMTLDETGPYRIIRVQGLAPTCLYMLQQLHDITTQFVSTARAASDPSEVPRPPKARFFVDPDDAYVYFCAPVPAPVAPSSRSEQFKSQLPMLAIDSCAAETPEQLSPATPEVGSASEFTIPSGIGDPMPASSPVSPPAQTTSMCGSPLHDPQWHAAWATLTA